MSLMNKYNNNNKGNKRNYPSNVIKELEKIGCTIAPVAYWQSALWAVKANGLWLGTLTRYYDGKDLWAFQTMEDGETWDNEDQDHFPIGCPPSKKAQHQLRVIIRATRRAELENYLANKARKEEK